MTNSRAKGCRGELEWAKFLTTKGFEARRGQQFSGSPDSPDVICEALKEYHFEVKRTERLSLYSAMDQAKQDACPETQTPILAHRRNRKDWMVVMTADDFIAMVLRLKCSTAP